MFATFLFLIASHILFLDLLNFFQLKNKKVNVARVQLNMYIPEDEHKL